jgi:hypothetical protein
MEDKKKVLVKICSYCEVEFHEVGAAMRHVMRQHGIEGKVTFSHGFCPRHYIKMMKEYGYNNEEIRIKFNSAKMNNNLAPDLEKHPELVDIYSKGIFTQEQYQQYILSLQQENQQVTERFKTLAGIHS